MKSKLVSMALPEQRYPDDAARIRFHQELLRGVEALPGVESAAVVNELPLSRTNVSGSFTIVGETAPPPGEEPQAEWVSASPGYRRTMGMRLLAGRDLGDGDRQGGARVILVNEALVRRALGGRNPIGVRLDLEGDQPCEIVGVVSDARRRTDIGEAPVPEVYFPAWQHVFDAMSLAVRTSGDPAALAGAVQARVAAVDRSQAVHDVKTMAQIVADARGSRASRP
jgi:hypothetical protein